MTINDLIPFYPEYDLYFFKDEEELQKAPLLSTDIKGFRIINEKIIIVDL